MYYKIEVISFSGRVKKTISLMVSNETLNETRFFSKLKEILNTNANIEYTFKTRCRALFLLDWPDDSLEEQIQNLCDNYKIWSEIETKTI